MSDTVGIQWQGFGLCFQDLLAALKPACSVLCDEFCFAITNVVVSFWGLNVVTKPCLSLIAREASKPKANLFCVIKGFLGWVESSHNKGSSQCSLLQNSGAANLKYSKLHMKCMLVTLEGGVLLLASILEFVPRCTVGFSVRKINCSLVILWHQENSVSKDVFEETLLKHYVV